MAVVAKVHHQQQQQKKKAAAGKGQERRMKRLPHVERVRLREREREQQPQCGDVAGGTAAGCATVFVCLPLAVVELVVLAAVRVPTALCVRAVRERGKQRRVAARRKELVAGDASLAKHAAAELEDEKEEWGAALAVAAVNSSFAECDEEDWANFSGAGFWRSPSQHEDCCC